jgi:NAD(P)-dependent dehydrogenase (short-subunit alcohol dehydrogenase family)
MSSNAKDRVIRDGLAWIVGVGASRGTGAALARRFAAEGLTVAITGRSDDNVNIIVREIETTGGRAIAAPGDVSKEEDVLAVLKHLETIGPIKVGIYNAGNAVWGPPLEATTAEFESMWRIGCLGGFVFGREIARSMLPRGQGYDPFYRCFGIAPGQGRVRRICRRQGWPAHRQPILCARIRAEGNSRRACHN